MFAFLRPGSRLRKEKGVREKRATNMDSSNTLSTPVPISYNGSGSGSEQQEVLSHTGPQDVFERGLKNSNYRSKMRMNEVGSGTSDKEKGLSSRGEAKTAVTTLGSSNTQSTRVQTFDENPTTTIPAGDVNFDPRTNDKVRKEKKKSSGLYALAFRVRDHNRQWQKDYSRTPPLSSTPSFSPGTTTLQKDVLSYGRQWDRDRRGVMEREKESEWDWVREKDRRKEKRRKPLASFGSLSSISGLSEYSTGGGRSDEGDASFSSKKDDHNPSVGDLEERITLEVALDEILTRCLPGVRVVR
jgi:hypothetical protein